MNQPISRRGFCRVAVSSGLALACGATVARADQPVLAALAPAPVTTALAGGVGEVESGLRAGMPRVLELFNTHTAETLRIAYRSATGFVPDALAKLQWLLRDHRANEAAPIDPLLFDQLAALAAAAGVAPRYQIISGYRSPHTNAKLAAAGRGVATKSLHMQGKALDVRLRGVPCDVLRDLALDAVEGGVGYYRKSDFVHLDTGRVRSWAG